MSLVRFMISLSYHFCPEKNTTACYMLCEETEKGADGGCG